MINGKNLNKIFSTFRIRILPVYKKDSNSKLTDRISWIWESVDRVKYKSFLVKFL